MNERIVKLFMQSVDSNYIPLPIEDHMPSWAEKFAQSIVRECMDVVRDINQEYDGGSTVVNAADEIAEHFGVEK